jgi:hypothetical protein
MEQNNSVRRAKEREREGEGEGERKACESVKENEWMAEAIDSRRLLISIKYINLLAI